MVRIFAAIPGKNLLQAIEDANEAFGIEATPEAQEASVDAQNAASLQRLERMMMGV